MASCVVFSPEGPLKGVPPFQHHRRDAWRRLRRIAPGAASGDARVRTERSPAPDLLLIDGGLGQIAAVHDVLAGLGSRIGAGRRGQGSGPPPGAGAALRYGAAAPRMPEAHSPALARLIQRIRDEAHRFAITGHRRRRARRYNESVLEAVPGLGPAKRRALLTHFGGLQGVMRAGVADLTEVAGIGAALARTLYDHLHPGS